MRGSKNWVDVMRRDAVQRRVQLEGPRNDLYFNAGCNDISIGVHVSLEREE